VETQLDYSDSFDAFDIFDDSADVKDRVRHKLKNVKRKTGIEPDVKRNNKPRRGIKISHYLDY
jgi:predicted DNA-binding WGR domain protein